MITFRGFLAAYEEGHDAARYEAESADSRLPKLAVGEHVDALHDVEPKGHATSPKPRYTEASLVKALEEKGIGRPSTFASIIDVIINREYVTKRGQALVPSWLAFSVVRLLEQHFTELVDYDFTAAMESDLDDIAAGSQDRQEWLTHFYWGNGDSNGLKGLVDGLGDIDARAVNSIELGEGITLRVGRYGPYLEAVGEDGETSRASIPEDVAPDELTLERARELLASRTDDSRELGTDPATGKPIVARNGRYGPYVTEVLPDDAPAKAKPRTASLFKSMQLETIHLEDALRLLSLPRTVGVAADGTEITAQNGRYGPYLKKGTDSRSLETEEQLFDVTLEQAEEIFAQPKQRRGAARAAAPLKELGTDPASGAPVVVKDGRFGPYVTDGTTNATLRKGDEIEALSPERAFELLAEKRAKGPAPKRSRKPAARKPAATRGTRTSKS